MNYTEVSRLLGQTYIFKHITASGLGDVQISIYAGTTTVVSSATMTELHTTGVYTYSFTPTTVGTYTGAMSSVSGLTNSVIDVLFSQEVTQSTIVISNSIGVGTKA